MPRYNYILLFIAIMFIPFFSCQTPLEEGVWIEQYEKGLPYKIYFPKGFFNSGKQFPLVLFLHGAGERGNDNENQLTHIAPILSSQSVQEKYPSILVFPQCPKDGYWAHVNRGDGIWTVKSSEHPTKAMSKVIGMLESLLPNEAIDNDRIYLSGLSMGGFGSFDLLSRKPNTFAAAVTICGGADLAKVSNYKHVPIWNAHGTKDPVVPVALSRDLVESLENVGGNIKYTEYPDGDHLVWDNIYNNPELIPWLFSQKRSK